MDIIGLIKKYIEERFRRLETMEIVIITEVDYSTYTCSVRPKARVGVLGVPTEMPVIAGVPIAIQKSGGSSVLMPIRVGDVCVAIFSKHALDNLLVNREVTTVTIPRNFDINDCMVIAGVFIETEKVPNILDGEMLLKHESGSYIKFSSNGDITIHTAGNIELKANRVDVNAV